MRIWVIQMHFPSSLLTILDLFIIHDASIHLNNIHFLSTSTETRPIVRMFVSPDLVQLERCSASRIMYAGSAFPQPDIWHEGPTPPLIELNSNYRKPFKQLTGNLRVLHHTRHIAWIVAALQHLKKSLDTSSFSTRLHQSHNPSYEEHSLSIAENTKCVEQHSEPLGDHWWRQGLFLVETTTMEALHFKRPPRMINYLKGWHIHHHPAIATPKHQFLFVPANPRSG